MVTFLTLICLGSWFAAFAVFVSAGTVIHEVIAGLLVINGTICAAAASLIHYSAKSSEELQQIKAIMASNLNPEPENVEPTQQPHAPSNG